MGKMKDNPRYNVISMRISDEEDSFVKGLVESGRFESKSAVLRHMVEIGKDALKQI